ncbi:HotDog domain-containing protein [Tricharina praecox]|uniref:HotDog domain-containing protein n=1 Tax=Tricharina praecox TaxID=43433 RepID=UPI002220CD9E|nr:HotDog domain-containing protein [Tricharina praecox]KAI5855625.1 HotDog domain-containing protein [Tricharina praecox]
MSIAAGLRRGAVAWARARALPTSSSVRASAGRGGISDIASAALYKRQISSTVFPGIRNFQPHSISLASPSRRLYSTATVHAPSTFSSRFKDHFYFHPIAWFGFAIASTIAGAAFVVMSAADFIAYSDEESLQRFTPSAPKQVEIEETINNHPLAISLRSKPEFTESRPTLKVHEQYRTASLTSGALAGPGKIEVPPYVWSEEGGKSLVSILYLGPELCGYPGLIHGGMLATLLDEGLARCCFPALPNKIGMTANLTINYRKPSPAESFVVLKAKTVKVEGRKAWVEGHIETLAQDGQEPVVLVEASALMIEPKQAKVRGLSLPQQ